jgi:iron complex transport system substrate-binding protein
MNSIAGTGMTRLLGGAFAAGLFAFLSMGIAIAGPFKDAAGRTVEIPAKIDRIIPAGPPAEVLLYALAPEKLAGLVEAFPAEGTNFVPAAFRKLGVIPRLSHGTSPSDVETLRHLSADLIVDYGNVSSNYAAAADKAQEQVGVPAILLDGKLAATSANLRQLGSLIGAPERGERLAGLAQKVLDKLAPLGTLGEAQRVSIYLARGGDGLNAVRSGTTLSEAIDLAGGRDVVTSGSGVFRKMTVEEVVALAPDVVVFEDPAALKSALRSALPAKTRVFLDQPSPFGTLESPPSVNRLIGAVALATVLHPDLMPADPAFLAGLQESFFGRIPAGQNFQPLLPN